MTFVDITIVPVARERRDAYVAFSRRMAEVYLDHGATRMTDHWQVDDPGDQADFHADGLAHDADALPGLAAAVGGSDAEAVVVTTTQWPSREARDAGVAAATRDPRVLATLDEDPVFDGARLVASSFEVTMDASRG